MALEKLNILYVDDEEQNLVSFKAAFRRQYNVFTAKGGKEGLEILKNNAIHLIITDQRMPEMTGVQFLEQAIAAYPDTIRIVLTGFSDTEAIVDAINTGRIFRYIQKPWDENELKLTIESARQMMELQLQNKRLVEELQQKVQEQEKTLRLFQKYVPEEVVQKTLNADGDSLFEGELRHVAVLFCDVRGFTSISEQISPKEVVAFLNSYYTIMTDCIRKHHGFVNQFVGDEIFACFGAPMASIKNEQNAVMCALEMISKLEVLNATYESRFGRKVEVGIGINAGEVVAGNTGSEDRIEYSITGDTVNTGSRIEELTKDFPNIILISGKVYEKVKHLVEVVCWDPVELKGKKEKCLIYEVLGLK